MDAGSAYRTKGLCDAEQRKGRGWERGSCGGWGAVVGQSAVGREEGGDRSLFYTILLYNSCLPESY